ncbi:hypothetical protein THOG11_160075 [Vibrio harveyi]|uniref:Uncharacterized protein n=1 Tax=Vibrio harveyi TaxID=669 RepID=A0A454CNU0_VIBHA|nr:hypothetical protein VCHENC01_0589 [Vibrio harveyi]EKM28067.1 hypothetical protein VCHENC02_5997 [Vibrio harveyi]CAH1205593.1 hypothetical protein TH15OA1_210069 [Vibrio harveyi]CAH1529429.1 hypothetical protein VHARVF571_220070 [Vibrio harveyi]CAH1551971.1 hypothetical protein THOD03_160074 [Vibrio harveyi]
MLLGLFDSSSSITFYFDPNAGFRGSDKQDCAYRNLAQIVICY